MSEKGYKILVYIIIGIVIFSIFSRSSRRSSQRKNSVQITTAADGLDLRLLPSLIKKASSAKELETLLNKKGNSTNNLDLDEDGHVDYIRVTEYGSKTSKGFSLTVEVKPGEEQEVATIQLEKQGNDNALVQVRGNENIYGHTVYYSSYLPLSTLLLWSYLSRPHAMYASPWHHGYYPSGYTFYPPINHSSYRQQSRSLLPKENRVQQSNRSQTTGNITSPNAKKNAASIQAPLRNPTTSQKSFQRRNPSKAISSGGFGRKTSSSRASVRMGSSRRSGSFFGGK